MKTIILTPLLAVGLLSASAAQANEALAKAKLCLACHAVEKRVVGPAYKDVASRYAGQKDAEVRLAEKILKGSRGSWGEVPMPPNATVKPDEAAALARWILSLK